MSASSGRPQVSQEELEAEARSWIESITGTPLQGATFAEALKDGVALCTLINSIKAGTIPKFSATRACGAGLCGLHATNASPPSETSLAPSRGSSFPALVADAHSLPHHPQLPTRTRRART